MSLPRTAPKASGKACTTPWSVMAMAGCPQAAACEISALAEAQASMVLICVCKCNSTRFLGALSSRTGLGTDITSETISTISRL